MTTTPLGDRLDRGRGASSIRTPRLIRDYLSGQGEFPEDTPEERAARPTQGDYIARMHRRIKLYIRDTDPTYQYPRHHSFVALVNNLLVLRLLEETGVREDPTQRGAGTLGTDGGFKQRVYLRLTEGSINRREWSDPMGFISLLYPNIRPAERPLPTAPPAPVITPAAPRPVGAAAPLALTELQTLEQRRQSIVAEARALASTGNSVEQFQRLLRRANAFVNDTTRALPPRPFPAAEEAGTLLANCIRLLDLERELSPRRVQAVINCQASSRLLAEALSTPLLARPMAVPGMLPVAELPDFELPPTPTRRNVALLARHLQLLQQMGVQRRDVQGRLAELEQDLLDWEGQLEEAIATESAREEPRPAVLRGMRRVLTAVGDAGSSLGVRDVAGAIEALGRAFPVAPEAPETPGPPPEERELPPVPTISLPARFSTRSVPRLVTHLQELAELAEEHEWPGEERPEDQWPEMEAEVARLLEAATGWRDAAQELLKEEQDKSSPSQAREEALGQRVEDLEEYVAALEAQDLTRAVEALEAIETME